MSRDLQLLESTTGRPYLNRPRPGGYALKLLKIAAVAVAVTLLTACGADRGDGKAVQAVQQSAAASETLVSPETFALGTAVTAQGAVPQDATGEIFLRGGEVYLSVDVSGASSDQNVEVKWVDPEGIVIRRDARLATRGTDHVPFSSGQTAQWRSGPHRAVVLIDGRTVSEKAFRVM
jgi:predicted small secreted protein